MHKRQLTNGEIALCRTVFGDAIDYLQVRLVRGKFWPFHPRGVAMAPMGEIYFHPERGGWSPDFSLEPPAAQGFFIHEMTHVWQAQKGGRFFLPLMRHPFCRYDYRRVPGKAFAAYGLEQQAEIVRHAFLAKIGAQPRADRQELAELLPFA